MKVLQLQEKEEVTISVLNTKNQKHEGTWIRITRDTHEKNVTVACNMNSEEYITSIY